jgi:hypothetical protein
MRHAYSIGALNLAAGALHLWKGDWRDALLRLDKAISVLRAGNIAILVPGMVASTAWALAQLGEPSEALRRLSDARQLLDGLVERGMVGCTPVPLSRWPAPVFCWAVSPRRASSPTSRWNRRHRWPF